MASDHRTSLVGKVSHRDESALLLYEADDGLSYLALVEDALALGGDALEGAGEVLLVEHLAGADRPAASGVDGGRGGELANHGVLGNVPGQQMGHREAVGRQVDGGGEDVGQGKRPVAVVHGRPASQQGGHGGGEDALHGDAGDLVPLQRGGVGSGAGGVDDLQGVVRLGVDHDEAVAADARHEGLDDADRRGDGKGGVDGVAAPLQRRHACLRRERVAAGHHAAAAHDDRPVRRE